MLFRSDAVAGSLVVPERGDNTVAIPSQRMVAETVLYHQMPSVFAGVAGDAAYARGAHWGNHHKDIFAHAGKYIMSRMKYASLCVKYAIELIAAVCYAFVP